MKPERKKEKGSECPNCGQKLSGENYCPTCGQENDISRPTTAEMVRESLSNFIAFDGRLVHTLHGLFRFPGKVAEDFTNGKRMQYMHPIRIYFLSSILLLFMFQLDDKADDLVVLDKGETTEITADSSVQGEVNKLLEIANKEADESSAPVKFKIDENSRGKSFSKLDRMYRYFEEHPQVPVEGALDSLQLKQSIWNSFLYTQSAKIQSFDDERFSEYFFSKIFWVLFLFLPILALLLKLMYMRRGFYYPEHLFFTFYTQAAFFLMMSLAYFINFIFGWDGVQFLFLALFTIFLFLSMRHFYKQSFGKTLAKFLVLNILGLPVFVAFFVSALLIAFILF